MKSFNGSSIIISLGAAVYMIYVFIDLTFSSLPEGEANQSLVDKFFPIVFLIVGLYMLRLAWEQYKGLRDGKSTTQAVSTVDAKDRQDAKDNVESK